MTKNKKPSFGLSLNNRAAVFLEGYGIADLLAMAERADDLPIDSVWVGDSLIDSPRYEPLTLLGAVAARTQRVKIGASILQPHFRNPVLLALSWATLDGLSGGRTVLTLGTGGGTPSGVAKEASISGIKTKDRGKALEENVEILRTLWKGETLHHKGAIYKMEDVKLGYLPIQKPPPIWIAAGVYVPKKGEGEVSATPGFTEKTSGVFSGAFDRVARLADGWFTIMASPEDFRKSSDTVSRLAQEHGREPDAIHRGIECWINVNATKERAKQEIKTMMKRYFGGHEIDSETVERWSIYGTRSDCIWRIQEYIDSGVQTVKLILGSEKQSTMLSTVSDSILRSF